MSIVYDLFSGNSSGGPVDYTTVLATTSSLSYALPPLSPSTSTRFAVRARDTATGLSDENTDAAVLITVGADGSDQTNVPMPPQALRAFATAGGSARLEWAWPFLAGPRPTGFHCYVWPAAGSPSYATPAATVAFAGVSRNAFCFGATLSGLSDGVAYRAAVRAFNATGEEPNTVAVAFTAVATPPANLASLSATPSY